MRTDEPILLLAASALCAFAVGCVSQKTDHVRYVDSGEIVTGTADRATMYDLESSAQSLMQKMLASPQFSRNYSAVKASKGGGLPIVVIGNIANKTTEPTTRSAIR